MSIRVDSNSSIYRWIDIALKSENIRDLKVFASGTSQKGDGFVGDIVFVQAKAVNFHDKSVEYNLVLKKSKENVKEIGDEKTLLIKRAFENETYFYTTIIPTFQKFENNKKLTPFDSLAKCYGGFSSGKQHALVFQNLKSLGYDLFNGKTLDKNHRLLTLETYGNFHAISFALKSERVQDFNKLCGGLECNTRAYLASQDFGDIMISVGDLISEILIQKNEERFLDIFEKKTKKGIINAIIDTLESGENDEKSVLCHADSWINNFVFQYDAKDEDQKNPLKVAFLDFQLTAINSPVHDLAYHLYCVLGDGDYKNIKQDLEVYYSFLSKRIRELGCDPAKIFPFCELVRHWKKYSFGGFMIAMMVNMLTVTDKEESLTLEEMSKESKNLIMNRLKPNVRERYFERVLSAVKHNLNDEL